MKKSRLILFSFIIFILAVIVFFSIASVVRERKNKKVPDIQGFYRPGSFPGLPYEHVPGAKGPLFGADVIINNYGLRGPEINDPKDPESVRVVVLGDSMVFGQGVGEKATLPFQLSEMLARNHPKIEWEVINAGVRGYDIEAYIVMLEKIVLPLDPDLLVLVITEINDPQREPFVPRSEKIERWGKSWWVKLPFVRTFLAGAYAEEVSRVYVEYVKGLYDPSGKEWPLFYKGLWEIQYQCRSKGVPIIFVTFPMLADEDLFKKEREQLQKTLDEMGVPWVDPRPLLIAHPEAELVVNARDFHPNGLALGITAQLLVEPIMKEMSK